MKKFLFVAAIAATFVACNDDKKTETTVADSSAMSTDAMMADTSAMAPAPATAAWMEGDHMMKDGKVMMMQGGQWVEMKETMTLSNGAKISAKGEVTMKGQKPMMMMEGEGMRMDGGMLDNMGNVKMMDDKMMDPKMDTMKKM